MKILKSQETKARKIHKLLLEAYGSSSTIAEAAYYQRAYDAIAQLLESASGETNEVTS